MMAANYRHIGGRENRLGRHYSRFSGIWPTAFVADQSLARQKSRNGGANRRRWANLGASGARKEHKGERRERFAGARFHRCVRDWSAPQSPPEGRKCSPAFLRRCGGPRRKRRVRKLGISRLRPQCLHLVSRFVRREQE